MEECKPAVGKVQGQVAGKESWLGEEMRLLQLQCIHTRDSTTSKAGENVYNRQLLRDSSKSSRKLHGQGHAKETQEWDENWTALVLRRLT